MSGMRSTGTLLGIIGAGLLWLAWLMQNGWLPRNELVGMRTGATTANDAAWLASHRASAWSVALAGAVLLAASLWLLLARQSVNTQRNVVLGSALIVVVVVVVGGIQADRVAKDTTRASSG